MHSETAAITIDDPGLSWSQLRSFEACATLRSFNGAAAALRLTPAAVRHQVALLEGRIGAMLFLRQGGRLALTTAGTRFAAAVAEPMRRLARACAEARSGAQATSLVLTAPPLFARHYLFDAAFVRWLNEAGVTIDVSDAHRDLLGPAPIAAIRLGAHDHPEIVQTQLRSNIKLQPAAARDIATGARMRDSAWWREQVLLTPTVAEPVWPRLWKTLGVDPPASPRKLRFTSYAAALDAACNGKGVVMAPMPIAAADVRSGRLRVLSNIRLDSPIAYTLMMHRDVANTASGKALRRRILAVVDKADG